MKSAMFVITSVLLLTSCGGYKKCSAVCNLGLELPQNPTNTQIVSCIDDKIVCLEGEYKLLKSQRRRLENQSFYLGSDLDNSHFHDSRLALQQADDASIQMARIKEEISQLEGYRAKFGTNSKRR